MEKEESNGAIVAHGVPSGGEISTWERWFCSSDMERLPRFRNGRHKQQTRQWEACFEEVNLTNADLRDAFLLSTRFENTDLSGSDFKGAYFIEDASFYECNFKDTKGIPKKLIKAWK